MESNNGILTEKEIQAITKFWNKKQFRTWSKKELAATLTGLIVKPQGLPTLAPESDKREELSPTIDDFDELKTERPNRLEGKNNKKSYYGKSND